MPPSNFQDLTKSPPFGHLKVIRRAPNGPKWHVRWECLCDCGQTTIVEANHLRSGHTTSCGCQSSRNKMVIHGMARTPEFHAFYHLKDRCTNPNAKEYRNYGGRGITVEWQSFEEFFADMGPRPTPQHTIERKNNDGNYSKANCIWATQETQQNNRRNNSWVIYEGQRYTVAQLSRHLGVHRNTLDARLRKQGLL